MPLPPQTTRSRLTSQKTVTPTPLDTEGVRLFWSDKRRNQALYSARTTSAAYLERVKGVLQEYQDGVGLAEEGASRDEITQGRARARMQMLEELQRLGIADGAPGDTRRLTDLASSVRLDLILETNAQVAHSLDQIQASSGPVARALYPAWELVRDEHRNEPRDWTARWNESAAAVGWQGVARNTARMVALKDSPIWARLGGYDDGLGNPFPPFAFGSGMGWEDVDAAEWDQISGGVHTPAQEKRIKEYAEAADPKAMEYYNKIQSAPKDQIGKQPSFVIVPECPKRMAMEIEKQTGINAEGWPIKVDSVHARHTDIRHGKQGKADHTMDPESFSRTAYVAEHFETCELALKDGKPYLNRHYNDSNDKGAPQLRFSMRIDGHAIVQEAIQDSKRKTIWLISSFKRASEAEMQAKAARRAYFREKGKRMAQGKH